MYGIRLIKKFFQIGAGVSPDFYGHATEYRQRMLATYQYYDTRKKQVVDSMGGTEWLKECRRLRSTGLRILSQGATKGAATF